MDNMIRKPVGSGASGWMMLLQVLLKPVLVVGGLFAGTSLLYAVLLTL
jgi:hypothetical protein